MPQSLHGEKGQSLVETALIIAFVALLVLGAVAIFGGEVNRLYLYIVANYP
jgi:Flp pilus assembly pilin Flp